MILQKNKSIGHVLFIVEGGRHEFTVLKQVFVKLLGYQMISKKRSKSKYEYFQSRNNSHNVVAVINTETSNIKSIKDENGFLDTIYEELIQKYYFDLQNSAIYYLFDRDVLSNTDRELIKELLKTLQNSRENENYLMGGLLLLSYPSIEAFDVSNFIDNTFSLEYKLGSELKDYIKDNAKAISLNKFNENTIQRANVEMLKYFKNNNIDLDLDHLGESNLQIFNNQEAFYMEEKKYKVISLLSLALLDLGILTES